MKKLNYYQGFLDECVQEDKARTEYIEKCRKILALDWELPQELKDLPWMRTFVTSAPADGVDAAVRTFSTIMPTISIRPNNTSSDERKRVEAIEDALSYHFRLANRRGLRSPLELMLDSVIRYGSISAEVRYLPYEFKGKTGARYSAMRKGGDFAYFVHSNPADTHVRHSPYGLEAVSYEYDISLANLIREVGDDNPGIQKLIVDVKEQDKGAVLEKTIVHYYDVMDYEVRVRWATIGSGFSATGGIEIQREEHGLKFLPRVYRESKGSLLKTVIDSGSWENQNIIMSLQYALLVSTVAQSRIATFTQDGEPMDVNYRDPGMPASGMVGEAVQVLSPPQTDPNLASMVKAGEGQLTQQMNTRALQAAEDIASSAPFATFNAIMQTAISSLSSQTKTAEAALEDAFCHQLYWVKHSGISLEGKRYKNRAGWKDNSMLAKGSTIIVGTPPEDSEMENFYDYDPDGMDLSVRLHADTPTDRQSRVNEAILLHDRMGLDWDSALEDAGLTDVERDEDKWAEEQWTIAMVQAEQQKIIGMAQLEVQQAQMQLQMGAQQAQMQQAQQMQNPQMQAQQMSQEAAMANAQGQGNNAAAGGISPASMMTREQITGQTQTGEEAMR